MPKGLFGRRMVAQPQWIAQLLDPFAHNRTPAENPNRRSTGMFPSNAGYSPPALSADIAAAGAQRTPFAGAVAPLDAQPLPEQMGMGGPLSSAHDIIPNAPAPSMSQAEMDNQAFAEALQRARAGIANEGYPYMRSPSWVNARVGQDRAVEQTRAAQAEQARREGITFDQWWHFGGRQDPSQRDPRDPYYRFNRPPPRR